MRAPRNIFANFLALGSGEAASRILAFGATIYLARVLGADGYGVLAFAAGVSLYLAKIADFAIEWVGTKEVADAPHSIPKLASAILSARLVLTIILTALSILAIQIFLSEPERSVLSLYCLTLVPIAANTKWIHMGLEDARPIGLSRLLGELLALTIVLGLVRGEAELWVPPVAVLSGESCVALLLILVLRKRSYKFGLRWDMRAVVPIFTKALPLLGHMLLGLFIYNSDLIFLRFFHSSTTVGFYAAAYTLISFIANIGIAYGMSLLPAFTRLVNGDGEREALYHTALAQIYAVSLPISIAGFLLAAQIIRLVFGDGYAHSVLALQIIIWSIPFNIFRNVPWAALIATNHDGLLFRAMLYGATANIVLNIALIPRYGIAGAAVATVITECMTSALMLRYAARHGLSFVALSRFLPATMAAMAMAAALVGLSPADLMMGCALGGIVYLLALSIFGGIRFRRGRFPALNV